MNRIILNLMTSVSLLLDTASMALKTLSLKVEVATNRRAEKVLVEFMANIDKEAS